MRSLPDGKAYRGSSLPSFCLQAKGSEHSLTTGRRVPERRSLRTRRYVRTQYSSSGPCVLNRWIEQKSEFFTTHFLAAAKVTHSRLRGGKAGLSSPPVNNFGRPISRRGRGENAEERSAAVVEDPAAARPTQAEVREPRHEKTVGNWDGSGSLVTRS